MELNRDDAVRFVYSAGVAVTGVYIQRGLETMDRLVIIAAACAAALGWTLYYRVYVLPRLVNEGGGEDLEAA